MATGGRLPSVEPVFLRQRDLPGRHTDRYDALNICLAAERVSGKETIHGAQSIKGLWRIYPLSRNARETLLLEGLEIGGQSLSLHARNPFILNNDTGIEVPTTKVWVSDIPISVENDDIESALVRVGCVLRSKLIMEKMRTKEGTLTRFVTGRRFAFINLPSKPLDRFFKVGGFTARLFYKELPDERKQVVCSRCLQAGHHVSACQNLVTCRSCHMSGHKQGDPICSAIPGSGFDLPSFGPFSAWAGGERGDDENRSSDRDRDRIEGGKKETRGEEKEEEGEVFLDSSSDLGQQQKSQGSFFTPSATYNTKGSRTVNKPAERAPKAGLSSCGTLLTPSKRPRSPAEDSLPSDALSKQVRLFEDSGSDLESGTGT